MRVYLWYWSNVILIVMMEYSAMGISGFDYFLINL